MKKLFFLAFTLIATALSAQPKVAWMAQDNTCLYLDEVAITQSFPTPTGYVYFANLQEVGANPDSYLIEVVENADGEFLSTKKTKVSGAQISAVAPYGTGWLIAFHPSDLEDPLLKYYIKAEDGGLEEVWAKKFPGELFFRVNSIQPVSDGYVLCGTDMYPEGNGWFMTTKVKKLDLLGKELWSHSLKFTASELNTLPYHHLETHTAVISNETMVFSVRDGITNHTTLIKLDREGKIVATEILPHFLVRNLAFNATTNTIAVIGDDLKMVCLDTMFAIIVREEMILPGFDSTVAISYTNQLNCVIAYKDHFLVSGGHYDKAYHEQKAVIFAVHPDTILWLETIHSGAPADVIDKMHLAPDGDLVVTGRFRTWNTGMFVPFTFMAKITNLSKVTVIPSGIQKRKEIVVSAYPNPATKGFTISGLTGSSKVSLYDLSGKEVKSVTVSGDDVYIERGSLTSGIYIFTVAGNNSWFTGKIQFQ